MTVYTNDCSGEVHGTTLTTANSAGGGTALDVATGGTRTFDTGWGGAPSGAPAWRLATTSATSTLGYTVAGGAVAARMFVRFSALPSGTCALMQVRNGGNAGNLQVRSDGTIRVTNDAGGEIHNGVVALSVDTDYRVEFRVAKGTGPSDGTYEWAVYAGNTTTVIDSGIAAATDAGTVDYDSLRFGILSTATWDVLIDDVTVDDTATALLGPVADPPAVAYVTAQAVTVDTAGSTGTVAVTQTAGTTATITQDGNDWLITRPAAHTDTLTFEVRASGPGGPDDVETFNVQPDTLAGLARVYVGGTVTDMANWQ